MSGEKNLEILLAELRPRLHEETYVFCSLPSGRVGDLAHASPIATVMEAEGLTVVISQAQADQEGLAYSGAFRCITLEVHSSLEAVGLTAAVSGALASRSISANMIAGAFHDHVFVPASAVEEAMTTLRALSTPAS